jgi:hypothetical protein
MPLLSSALQLILAPMTMTGGPQGGTISPVGSNLVLDGLEAVVHGGTWHRRLHNINDVRWADDFIGTANSRAVWEETILPRINAFVAERGVRLSTAKTVITPITEGFDFLGQTLRKHERPPGKPAKLQITPSKASSQGITTQVKALCKQAVGATPARLIDRLNPRFAGLGTLSSARYLGWDLRHTGPFCVAKAVSMGQAPPPGSNRPLDYETLLSPSSGRILAMHRSDERQADHPGAGGGQTSATYQDQGQRPPVRSAIGGVLSTLWSTARTEDNFGIACESPEPAEGVVSHLPTGDPERGEPRTASSGWQPPE